MPFIMVTLVIFTITPFVTYIIVLSKWELLVLKLVGV
jgi:hypothetical protein